MNRYVALVLEDPNRSAWKVQLTTAKNPDEQLATLTRLVGALPVDPPRVFENTSYTVTITSGEGWEITSVGHRVRQDVAEAFEPLEPAGAAHRRWHGTLNFGNDLGWFFLELEARRDGTSASLRDRAGWQVWPLKLNYASDFRKMIRQVEDVYPLWLFRFDTATVHDAGRSSLRDQGLLLLWFAQFDRLWETFERGLGAVVQNPHVQLDGQPARLRADRLRGKLNHRLAQDVVLHRKESERTYAVQRWRSSLDTPENRFVRHTIETALRALERFATLVENPSLSELFRTRLLGRLSRLRALRSDPMFRGLSTFSGLVQESLVLHHRSGYSDVYRVWLELRFGLEFFANVNNTQIGMRSVNELYEIWCFLELRKVLAELEFAETQQTKPRWRDTGLERQLDEGKGASFEFERRGLRVRLSHEPTYGKTNKGGLRSYTISQRPDIVLEAGGLVWIFDAKYRLKSPSDDLTKVDSGRSGEWLAPPDTLNQMHRYRDSILLHEESKSRPVISAFALFPSPVDQTAPLESNPYWNDIVEVGIGAFPLVPKEDGSGRLWLKQYLSAQLAQLDSEDGDVLEHDNVQIPVTGLAYRERDLLIIPVERLAGSIDLEQLREGRAESVELPADFHPDRRRLGSVTFVGFLFEASPGQSRSIHGVYRVSEGWPMAAGTLHLSTYLAPPTPKGVAWKGGSWFRYSDVAGVLGVSPH
ncbi:MAG: DUF2357 domain-containing protein [Spirochaetales bacterium]